MRRVQRVFGIHPLAISLLRRALGVLVLVDLAMRAADFRAHYTGEGALPAAAVSDPAASVYWISDAPGWAMAMFVLTAIAAVLAIAGWRPRWVGLALWVLVLSLHHRNPAVFHSGDTVLRLALFWCVLLPVASKQPAVSVATVGFTVQVALIFLCALDFKLRGTAWLAGYAVRDALGVTLYARPFVSSIAMSSGLVAALTWATLAGQGVAPLLLLLPVRTWWPRTLGVALIVSMQAGFGVFLRLGTFPFAVSICAVALLPSELFDRIPRAQGAVEPPRPSPFWNVVAGFALCLILIWNLGEAGAALISGEEAVPLQLTAPGRFSRQVGLDQRWAMFAPNPQTEDGRFAFTARLADGERVEILDDVVAAKGASDPMRIDHRWLLYLLDLQARSSPAQLDALLKYACRVSAVPAVEVTMTFRHFERLADGTHTPEQFDTLASTACPKVSP